MSSILDHFDFFSIFSLFFPLCILTAPQWHQPQSLSLFLQLPWPSPHTKNRYCDTWYTPEENKVNLGLCQKGCRWNNSLLASFFFWVGRPLLLSSLWLWPLWPAGQVGRRCWWEIKDWGLKVKVHGGCCGTLAAEGKLGQWHGLVGETLGGQHGEGVTWGTHTERTQQGGLNKA